MNIGDYVRTKKGTFDRFITSHTQDGLTWYSFEDKGNMTNPENYIIKSSPNIIDLIEVGDVIKAKTDVKYYEVINKHNEYLSVIDDDYVSIKDIEAVITKEQIERNEYKI